MFCGFCPIDVFQICHGFRFSSRNFMLASLVVLRRQQFLMRTLGADDAHQKKMQEVKFSGGPNSEADADDILRVITPTLDSNRHKGQAGKLK